MGEKSFISLRTGNGRKMEKELPKDGPEIQSKTGGSKVGAVLSRGKKCLMKK